ncbi:MAG: class I SAM-dependent methyltransferase [Acaryochloridaceae cyanobacterium SU_2_1]|nr:class I SAM-dependent methyltransferase [Acaryochloridaceae cyanobacterium SU_2_1]
MKIDLLNCFLKDKIKEEFSLYFGIQNEQLIEKIANEWFNESHDFDGRWDIIMARQKSDNKILDLAAGCGTFLLFGLNQGYDVWGVEPETWKLEFFKKKVTDSGYSSEFLTHMISGKGEALPFEDNSFDLITSYQTLEHVESVSQCLQEMMRVLRPNGTLYIKCPDYNSFYEPHYQLPFCL